MIATAIETALNGAHLHGGSLPLGWYLHDPASLVVGGIWLAMVLGLAWVVWKVIRENRAKRNR